MAKNWNFPSFGEHFLFERFLIPGSINPKRNTETTPLGNWKKGAYSGFIEKVRINNELLELMIELSAETEC